jgi:hypothetical protein
MALIDLISEMTEEIPALDRVQAKKYVNRAWRVVEDSCLWSFQLGQGGFSTPQVTTGGTITAALGSNQIIGDATATAQWLALPFYWSPTVQQIRANGFSIYSIIAIDTTTNPPFATLTLDRNFVDPLPFFTGVGYQMFMQYIACPPRFKRWFTIADMFNCWALDIWTGKRTVDLTDPARLYTSNPSCALAFGTDKRGAGTTNPSATLGQELYELYPTPQTEISYQTYYAQYAGPLISNTDTLPFQVDEEIVLWRAKVYGYQWAEARKDVMAAKGSGANYLSLKKSANDEFYQRLKTARLVDREAVDSYMVNMKAALAGFRGFGMPYFNALSGTANMGIGGWR